MAYLFYILAAKKLQKLFHNDSLSEDEREKYDSQKDMEDDRKFSENIFAWNLCELKKGIFHNFEGTKEQGLSR